MKINYLKAFVLQLINIILLSTQVLKNIKTNFVDSVRKFLKLSHQTMLKSMLEKIFLLLNSESFKNVFISKLNYLIILFL